MSEKGMVVRGITLVKKRPSNGAGSKDWVFVTYPYPNGPTRAISFEELYYICKWIGECEDIKYPEAHHKGAEMLIEFIQEATYGFLSYEQLAKKYQLPPSRHSYDPRQTTML